MNGNMEDVLEMRLLQANTTNSNEPRIVSRLLLENLRAADFHAFTTLLMPDSRNGSSTVVDVNQPIDSDETLLDVACRLGLTEFVDFLLKKGANPNLVNKNRNRGPIHYAVEANQPTVLVQLLSHPSANPNVLAGQQTALHLAVNKNDLECAKILLDNNASPNIPNNRGITALHLAAMKNRNEMARMIIQRTKHLLDLDSYKDYNNETARDVLQRNIPNINLPPPRERQVDANDLRYYLNANDEINFIENLERMLLNGDEIPIDAARDVLRLAVEKNFHNAVRKIMSTVTKLSSDEDFLHSAIVAVRRGNVRILNEFLKARPKLANGLILEACLELYSGDPVTRLECLKLILNVDGVNVRQVDEKGNTLLHYAARSGNVEAIRLLLQKGCYIGRMNEFHVPPMADISATVLSEYFDECLRLRKERASEYSIEFDYRCLMPSGEIDEFSNKSTASRHKIAPIERMSEMRTLEYMANNAELRPLLKHPLMSSFLYLKWRRVSFMLYANFAFYLIFYVSLNTYILFTPYKEENGETEEIITKENKSDNFRTNEENGVSHHTLLWIITLISILSLMLRELLQLLSAPWHYVCSLENWLEVALITLGLILLNDDTAIVRHQLGSIAILLSAWELVILIGQHPRMSTGIQLFKTVSVNFVRFLFLYAFLILAFALAFFTLFKNADDNFPTPGRSLFKTIIMLTGEFEAGDIAFSIYPILSHLIFILFVFFIAIVLFNLLNGMAVSDTTEILGKAELVGLVSRARLIAYIENVGLGGSNWLSSSSKFCMSRDDWTTRRPEYNRQKSLKNSWNPLSLLARRLLLFNDYLPEGKLLVKPLEDYDTYRLTNVNRDDFSINRTEETSVERDVESHWYSGKHCCFRCLGLKMEPEIVRRAKNIALSKNETSNYELMTLEERLTRIENKLSSIERAISNNNFVNTSNDDKS